MAESQADISVVAVKSQPSGMNVGDDWFINSLKLITSNVYVS